MTPALNAFAIDRGEWPDDAKVFLIEAIGTDKNPQVLLTGSVPVGVKKNGRPDFGRKGSQPQYKIAVSLADYRGCFT